MTTGRSALIILKKEVRESLRDRKTLIVMVLLPLLLYPLLFLGISAVSMMQHQKLEESDVVWAEGLPASVRQALADIPATRLLGVMPAAVAEGKVHVAICWEQVTVPVRKACCPSGSYSTVVVTLRGRARRGCKALSNLRKQIQDERLGKRAYARFIEPIRWKWKTLHHP